MVKRGNAPRRKTRHLMQKSHRRKGKLSISRYFQSFEKGAKVQLVMEPSVQQGIYDTRFYGRTGEVQKKQGACYLVQIKDGGKRKNILSHPVHLKLI